MGGSAPRRMTQTAKSGCASDGGATSVIHQQEQRGSFTVTYRQMDIPSTRLRCVRLRRSAFTLSLIVSQPEHQSAST